MQHEVRRTLFFVSPAVQDGAGPVREGWERLLLNIDSHDKSRPEPR